MSGQTFAKGKSLPRWLKNLFHYMSELIDLIEFLCCNLDRAVFQGLCFR